jgi:hypothetical protein
VQHFPFAAPARERFAPGLRVTFHDRYAIYDRPLLDAAACHGSRHIRLESQAEDAYPLSHE